MTTLQGTWPALITPFDRRGEVNTAALRDLVGYLLDQRVDGFYVCGSTGEGLTMSVEERQRVAESVLAQVSGRVPVIVHVGAVAVPDAVALTRHAQAHGATAISSIIPPRYGALEAVVRYFETLIGAAPGLGVMPYLMNPQIDPLALLHALLDCPAVIGTKYTGADMNLLRQIVDLGRERGWTVMAGMDEHSVYATMSGANGHIGSTLNLMPGAYRRIRTLAESGQHAEAQRLQERANAIINLIYSTGRFPAGLKIAMSTLGPDCGDPRLPELPLSDAQKDDLRARLTASDFAGLAAM
ncbi:MAG: dihydrodipicolinate synthase family protein [Chloroflexota bacterium]